MLAGLDDTDTGRAHAEELRAAARAHREADRAADNGASPRRGGRRKKQAVARG
jgi:DNA repair protein RecN (Recombination protein N)